MCVGGAYYAPQQGLKGGGARSMNALKSKTCLELEIYRDRIHCRITSLASLTLTYTGFVRLVILSIVIHVLFFVSRSLF